MGTLFPLSYNLQLVVQIQRFQLQEIPGYCPSVKSEIYLTKNAEDLSNQIIITQMTSLSISRSFDQLGDQSSPCRSLSAAMQTDPETPSSSSSCVNSLDARDYLFQLLDC